MTPRPVACPPPLGRVVSNPPTAEQLRLAAARAWHQQGAVCFPAQVLAELTPAHRSFVERVAASLYGQRNGGTV